MPIKFRMQFSTVEDVECQVLFYFNDYYGDIIELKGGARPFVLGEFNTEDNLFKPIRAQQATIEILASSAGVSLEDFTADNDADIQVVFQFGSFSNYWSGFLSQEDMQETWISTNHILTLRADDGYGLLKNITLADVQGNQLDGRYKVLDVMTYAARQLSNNLSAGVIISNLFHISMDDSANQTGLDQCYIDDRTFETGVDVFENQYDVLAKINTSWAQTIFTYRSQAHILRIPELFTDGNIDGFTFDEISRTAFSKRFDVNVGIDELVKPIAPEMLKTLRKPSKKTSVIYKYVYPPQLICNQNFQQGDKLTDTPLQKTFKINLWNVYQGDKETPTATTATFTRLETYNVINEITDNYAILRRPELLPQAWAESCEIFMSEGDILEFSIQTKPAGSFVGIFQVAQVFFKRFESLQYRYGLNNDGDWIRSTSDFNAANVPYITADISASLDNNNWTSVNILSKPIPFNGTLKILLISKFPSGLNPVHFKDLQLNVIPINAGIYDRNIQGDIDRYEAANRWLNNFDDETYLDDTSNRYYKGALFESDGETPTTEDWYRLRDFNNNNATTERFSFKRQNALAKWYLNNKYRMKLDCNFYGLTWNDAGTLRPIGLINTIKFVDDAPTKIFAITDLREIDFQANTWTASLLEIYDTEIDDNEPDGTVTHTNELYYG